MNKTDNFFKGGSGFKPKNALEKTKFFFCSIIYEVFESYYESDRAKFMKALSVDTSTLDDLLNLRYGAFTSDFIISKIDQLITIDKALKKHLKKKIPEIGKESLVTQLKLLKGIEILKTANEIDDESLSSTNITKTVLNGLKKRKVGAITLDFLISEFESLNKLTKLEIPYQESLKDKIKKSLCSKINIFVRLNKISNIEVSKISGLHKTTISKIKQCKVDRISIDKIIEVISALKKSDLNNKEVLNILL